jgi:hypothetical protein
MGNPFDDQLRPAPAFQLVAKLVLLPLGDKG